MPKKIILTGATGLIGSHIASALIKRGDKLTIFSRSPERARAEIQGAAEYVHWDSQFSTGWEQYLNGKDAVIHLAGTPVMEKRWTNSHKSKVLSSRMAGTKEIVEAISSAELKPEVFVCASAIGYYGTSAEGVLTEESPAGSDFLATVCKLWEKEAARAERFNVRRVSIRLGIVLSKEGGALGKMLLPYKLFAGGPLAKGTQGFPWIHIDDVVNIFLRTVDNSLMQGPYNAVAPRITTMNEFSKSIGKVLHRPAWFRVPGFVLNIVVGEGAETITKTPKVLPQKLINQGYEFLYTDPESALKEIFL